MDKEAILKKVSKIDDKLLISKILDKYILSSKTRCVTHSDFLDPYQKTIVEKSLSAGGIRDYCLYGGYDGAERTMVVFCPNSMYSKEYSFEDDLIKVLRVAIRSKEDLTHRDYLGSLMGLGIKREKIGDILVKEDYCLVVVQEEIAEYITYNLIKVGNANALTQMVDISMLQSEEPRIKEISSTVASLRLDSVASVGFGISRSKVAELIKAEKVSLNWVPTANVTKTVNEGDTISIRGKGRVILDKIGNTTKKDRIHILLKKFV